MIQAREVFTIQMYSNDELVNNAYRIFASRSAAEQFIAAFEKYFATRKGPAKRSIEGFDNVRFEIRSRSLLCYANQYDKFLGDFT